MTKAIDVSSNSNQSTSVEAKNAKRFRNLTVLKCAKKLAETLFSGNNSIGVDSSQVEVL